MTNKVYSLFGPSGCMEEIKPIENLPIGTRVYSFGAGMSENIWAVADDKNNLVKISKNYSDDYFCNPFTKLDKYSKPISKKFGIGFYYDDENPDFRFSDVDILQATEKAKIFIAEENARNQAQAEADSNEIKNLPAIYKHLTPSTDLHDQKQTKNNLIADLKHLFPGVKFSVRKEHYDTFNISWINGPTVADVSKVGNKFEDHCSSSCGDFRDSNPSNFNKVFGGFKYVFENREFCDKIKTLYGDYSDRNLNSVLNKLLYDMTIPDNFLSVALNQSGQRDEIVFELAPETTPIKSNTSPSNIQIVDYSDKAIAVIGDTKQIKDKLKEMGGKFNFRLKCGAGWIFPKTKLSLIQSFLCL